MPGKSIRTLKFQSLFSAERLSSTSTVLYNGQAAAGAVGIDTQDFDEAIFVVNFGTLSAGTYDFAITSYPTDTAGSSIAVTGADFTQVTTSDDETQQIGYVRVADVNRYVYCRSTSSVSAGNADFTVIAVLSRKDTETENNEVFEV